MLKNIIFRIEIFREGDLYIGLCPELNVSSFDGTVEGAKKSIKEAVELFLEECEKSGTLEAVLEESGFHRTEKPQDGWATRDPIMIEKVNMATA